MSSKKVLTLVYILDQDKILLGLKKRGFGEGRWNGFGGKLQPGETIAQGAIREVKEECGLRVSEEDLTHMGIIDFEFVGDPMHLEVYVFLAKKFEGVVTESDEMAPKWFNLDEMPYDLMWPDDKYWHPIVFSGQKFTAYFLFEGMDSVLESKILPSDNLSLDMKA